MFLFSGETNKNLVFNKQPGAAQTRGDGDGGCNYPVKSDESNKRCRLTCTSAFGWLHPDAALLAVCQRRWGNVDLSCSSLLTHTSSTQLRRCSMTVFLMQLLSWSWSPHTYKRRNKTLRNLAGLGQRGDLDRSRMSTEEPLNRLREAGESWWDQQKPSKDDILKKNAIICF